MLKKINLKHLLIITIIYLVLNILIFYSGIGFIDVNAKTFDYELKNMSFWRIEDNHSAFYDLRAQDNRFYFVSPDLEERFSFNSFFLNYELLNREDFYENSFVSGDKVYFSGILHFKYDYDVSLVKNLSFTNLLTSTSGNFNQFALFPYSDAVFDSLAHSYEHKAEIVDYDSYITISDSGEYSYHEILVFNNSLDFSIVNKNWSPRLSILNGLPIPNLLSQSEFTGTIPPKPGSYIELNQFVISDEEIIMTLEDFNDTENSTHYDPGLVDFPDYEEDVEDNSILGFIKRIFNKILDVFKFIAKIPVLIENVIINVLSDLFVPDIESFKSSWNTNFELFQEQLGFLFLPFDIIEEFLNRYLDLGDGSGVIHIPDIKEPFSGHILISARDFNLREIFSNGAFGTVHSYYLMIIDIIIVVALINLSWKKYDEIFNNRGGDE